MSDFLKSLLRELAQKLVGVGALWLVAHGIEVPDAVTNWVILALVAGGLVAWTTAVRFLETRDEYTVFGRAARGLARLLMLGIKSTPSYPPAVPESVTQLRNR